MSIIVRDVCKKFGDFIALDRVSLLIESGSLVALLGPSGSGKSTLLRAIAGLESPDQGFIYINGQDTTHLEVRKRNIGFVFQHYALFKHLTVKQNIAFGLEIRREQPNKIRQKVNELLELIQLEGLGNRYPSQLSGGQRQRVALARSLAIEPQVLLLDEPFGALDAKVRKDLRAWLRDLHQKVHVTTVFVTHDQEEAMEVSDQIVVMNHGKIEQIGSPAEIYDHPATPFVMSFIGAVNILPRFEQEHFQPEPTELFIRPHDLVVETEAVPGAMAATVKRLIHLGREIQVEIALETGLLVMAILTREKFTQLNLKPEQTVYLGLEKTRSFVKAA